MIEAGKLNRIIALQRRTVAHDEYNAETETWADESVIWAEAITSGGREFYAAQKLNAETSVVFRIRHTRNINTQMRVRWGGRYFAILSAEDPTGRREEILISAKEVV
ncbi:phage head closure protein [Papillibacter cinnamivorans]|uniref:Phage head-tail adaptor, putative, SPP1 family n=1 Tax=Papillibacter cinnamivorans DSM 12816 TaxID=1122930 RepID=A0A1W1YR02_9FIRM|nr:phage head closure protein [Papillibacter cinnamivorans]SMC38542.1 phage head-tail adaptor, putative, SPP1 family [Papillibacter cinnamivorans DSM 12816]